MNSRTGQMTSFSRTGQIMSWAHASSGRATSTPHNVAKQISWGEDQKPTQPVPLLKYWAFELIHVDN